MSAQDWEKVRLDSLGTDCEPTLKAGPFGSSIVKASYETSGYKLYGQQEVIARSTDTTGYYVSEDTYAENRSCAVRTGDVLITMMGTVGQTFVIPPDAEPGIINPRLMRIRIDRSRVDPNFLNAYMGSTAVQALLERRAHGGTMLGLNAQSVGSIAVPVPPMSDQRKIAEILRTWDDAIERLNALHRVALKERDWLRQNVLTGVRRLTAVGEWRLAQLSGVLLEHRQRSTGVEEVFSVSVHKGLVNQIEHLGRSFSATNTAHYNRVSHGDIVYTKSPTGDFPLGIIKQSTVEEDVLVSPLYGVFTPATFELGIILNAYFESPSLTQRYLHPLVQKGAKNTIAITNQRFLEGQLSLPVSTDEQKAIAEVLNDSTIQLRAIERERSELMTQKRGLMQKLLTGEIRVTGDDAESLGEASNG